MIFQLALGFWGKKRSSYCNQTEFFSLLLGSWSLWAMSKALLLLNQVLYQSPLGTFWNLDSRALFPIAYNPIDLHLLPYVTVPSTSLKFTSRWPPRKSLLHTHRHTYNDYRNLPQSQNTLGNLVPKCKWLSFNYL